MIKLKLEPLKLLVIGKTGVGKSAFCNFLFMEEVFESAAGAPVTEGIQAHQFKLEDIDVVVYDTEGIEACNAREWENRLDKVIGYSFNYYKKTEKMHGIFYLVNASSARIEDFEIKLIKQFSKNRNMPVFVVLTHKDLAKPDQVKNIKSQLKIIKGVNVISICSVQKKLRGGRVSVSNEYLKESRIKLTTSFLETSGRYYLYDNIFVLLVAFQDAISELRRKILGEISDAKISIFNITEWEGKLERISDNLENSLESFQPQFESLLEQLQQACDALSPHVTSNPFEDIIDTIFNSVDIDLEIDQIKSLKSIQKDMELLEYGEGFISKVGAGLSLGYKAVTAESTLKEIAEDGIELLTKFLNEKMSEAENQFSKESWVYKK